jgi:UDP-glucose 4-epimerase
LKVLVTGGAGYVGSVVADELLNAGHEVTVLDNLQQGHQDAMPVGAQFILADISKPEALNEVFRQSGIDAVMHMAAETVIEYSATDPKRFFHTNVTGGTNLLNAMLKHNVTRMIFSSTAAVYGEPQTTPIEEHHPKNPINAYGLSKLMFEQILEWYGKAYGLKHISLRYFNAAGATERLGEDHRPETHLIPNVLRAAMTKQPVSVFGTDYPTTDGTCIRDYVHVIDIARAHTLALGKLDDLSGRAYNLGNAKGYSVMEVIQAARKVTGLNVLTTVCPGRRGDPATLVASSDLARSQLGWKPQFFELESIIRNAWLWTMHHPRGYACHQ